jgi:hypothetical protein
MKPAWKVYTMTDGSGKVAFSLIGEFATKREAVACIPSNARNVVRVGRVYAFIPAGR